MSRKHRGPCGVCGETDRYVYSGACRTCRSMRVPESVRKQKAAAGRLGGIASAERYPARQLPEPDNAAHPFDGTQSDHEARLSADESYGISLYYKSAYFRNCEMCRLPLIGTDVVCHPCDSRMTGRQSHETVMRTPDVSGVRDVLATLIANANRLGPFAEMI